MSALGLMGGVRCGLGHGMRLDHGYRVNIIVANAVLLKIKSIERILPLHEAQLLTCLRFSDCRVGLLLNFNAAALGDGTRRRVR